LLLDSNKLGSILPTPSSSSSSSACTPCQPHSALQTLSLTNNQLTSIVCSSSSPAHSREPAHATSSSSCGSSAPVRCSTLQGLSSWLLGLQTLKLCGNQLRDLCGLESCCSLRALDVSRNQLTDLQV
jgi:Leucine-rich repeat (LRR) protein